MKRFRLSLEAAANIREIWEFIAKDNVSAAGRVRQELYDAIRGLAKMSGKGHTREDLTDKASSVLAGTLVPHCLPARYQASGDRCRYSWSERYSSASAKDLSVDFGLLQDSR